MLISASLESAVVSGLIYWSQGCKMSMSRTAFQAKVALCLPTSKGAIGAPELRRHATRVEFRVYGLGV